MKLTAKKLQKYIELIYHGNHVQFARDIAHHPDTVRHWKSGNWTIPSERLIPELERLARFYGQRNFDLAKELSDV